MNQLGQIFLLFVVGLAGGLMGSLILSDPAGQGGAGESSSSISTDSADARLTARLDELQDTLDILVEDVARQRSNLAILDTRLAGVQAERRSNRDGDRGGAAPQDPFAGLDPSEIPTGRGFDAAVIAAVEKREADAAAQREVERAQRREEQLERQMERYIEELGLDDYQAGQMKTILNDTSVARNEFFTEMRESGVMDRQLIREKMTEINDSQIEQLGNVLTSVQMSQYTEMTANAGFGGGGGRWSGGNSGGRTGGG